MKGLIKMMADREEKKQGENLQVIIPILKNKIMKQNRTSLLIISLTVFLTVMLVFYFSINFFKGFYESIGHFEYSIVRPVQ